MRYSLRTLPCQFTLRGIFIATFWSALWCWALLADFKGQGSDGPMMGIIAFRIAGPFVTIGALFGRAWIGAIVGAAVVVVLVAIAYISMMNSSTFP
jgi:hypothetical protein